MQARLREDLKIFMKAKDSEKMNVVRGILSEINNLRDIKNIEITQDEIIKVLRRELKKRKESIESFTKAARQDLVDKEKREMELIEKYLPADLTDEQVLQKVKEVFQSAADKTFGAIMKASVAAVGGQADGKRISAIVKKVIESETRK
ncbi:MAG: GatB/YqeY domain-containing protein [Elusimicrobiota bacterium]|jgi:uncharacterized protein YqeY|nr:GatB/YqeY domain-containing protein [Elusimicrobiota bacterium]